MSFGNTNGKRGEFSGHSGIARALLLGGGLAVERKAGAAPSEIYSDLFARFLHNIVVNTERGIRVIPDKKREEVSELVTLTKISLQKYRFTSCAQHFLIPTSPSIPPGSGRPHKPTKEKP
jgi:hypothetical protein